MIKWFAENKVAANLLMILIISLGLFASNDIRREVMPKSELDILFIQAVYPGASPNVVEQSILQPLEEVLEGISGIVTMRSYAKQNTGSITIEIARSAETKTVEKEINQGIEMLRTWPKGVDRPQVRSLSISKDLVTYLILSGEMDQQDLKSLALQTKEALRQLPGVSEIEIGNVPDNEIRIEIHDDALQRYQLSFDEVLLAVKKQLTSGPGGDIELSTGPSSIVTKKNIAEHPSQLAGELEHLVVRSFPDRSSVKLIDIGHVVDGFASQHYRGTYNGKPAVYLTIYRQGNESMIEIADTVHQYIEGLQASLPEGIQATAWQDTSRHYVSRITLLQKNGVIGLAILFVILLVFLNARLAFWISLGIPVAFLGAFIVMPWLDVSINMISTFGFILVLGIVVDDAIIVGENVHRWQERLPYADRDSLHHATAAAIRGTRQIAKPLLLAVLTTIIMFTPLALLPGHEGKLIRGIPIVVIAILVFSMVESFWILPAHLSMRFRPSFKNRKTKQEKRKLKRYFKLNKWDPKFWFKPLLSYCLYWRYVVFMSFLGVFVIGVALITGQWFTISILSPIEADTVLAEVHHPAGTPSYQVNDSIQALEQAANATNQFFTDKLQLATPAFLNVVALYGQTIRQKAPHVGVVLIELPPTENRQLNTQDIIAQWRQQLPESLKNVDIRFESSLNKPGPPINIKLKSREISKLASASAFLQEQLAQFSGVYNIRDDLEKGAREVVVTPLKSAGHLGISAEDLTRQIRQMFNGIELMQFNRSGARIPIRLQLPSSEKNLWKLETLPIALPTGQHRPLSDLARVELNNSAAVIKRMNGHRTVRVVAEVDPTQANSATLLRTIEKTVLPELQVRYPAVYWQKGGLTKNRVEVLEKLARYSLISIMVMYALMAVLFRSYIQPFLVLFAVPFGLLGAFLGHIVMQIDLTILSMVGMTAVSGVVVNDNLVLLDYVNTQYRMTKNLQQSVLQAATARLRPILLTTVTSFFGLLPLLFEASIQAQFLIPMATSMAFGVLFATLVSLILVPIMVIILNDLIALLEFKVEKPLLAPQAR